MRFSGIVSALFALGLSACQGTRVGFVSLNEYADAELLLLVVIARGQPDLSRSEVVLPNAEISRTIRIELEDDELLLLLGFDEAALTRGAGPVAPLAHDLVSLHAPSGQDCGPRGEDVSTSAERITAVRQTLSRFAPTVRVLKADKEEILPGVLSAFGDLGAFELELPVDSEPCQDRLRLELVPFTEGGLFSNGLGLPGTPFVEHIIGLWPVGGERWFVWSYTAIYFVRRGVPFDPQLDRRLSREQTALPGLDHSRWLLEDGIVEPGSTLGSHRLLFLFRHLRNDRNSEGGWALLEVVFDGDQFQSSTIRWEFEGPESANFGGTALARSPDGSLMAVGGRGSYALAPSLDSAFLGGAYDRGDFEAAAFSGDPVRPQLLGVRGGLIGVGDLSRSELELFQGREGTSVLELLVAQRSGEAWLYSGWKDGQTFHGPLAARPPELRPTGLTVPRRAENCWDARSQLCGRHLPYGKVFGLELSQSPGKEDLLVAVFEECASVLVHELESGCTTSVEFPDRSPIDAQATRLTRHGEHFFVTDNAGTLFELRIAGR